MRTSVKSFSHAIVVALAASLAACDGLITRETERAWQVEFRACLLDGYTGFKGLEWSADVGVAIFQYRLPNAVSWGDATKLIAGRLRPTCNRVVTLSARELQVRCANRTGSSASAFIEYRAIVNPTTRTVTVMWGDFDSDDEIQDYRAFADILERHSQETAR